MHVGEPGVSHEPLANASEYYVAASAGEQPVSIVAVARQPHSAGVRSQAFAPHAANQTWRMLLVGLQRLAPDLALFRVALWAITKVPLYLIYFFYVVVMFTFVYLALRPEILFICGEKVLNLFPAYLNYAANRIMGYLNEPQAPVSFQMFDSNSTVMISKPTAAPPSLDTLSLLQCFACYVVYQHFG